ncbi:MAG: twin-arginine translocation signal domain-containing protein [Coriobacteriia bacterium]|nr:twin-arginine translocation signal domain-containing protein [Coriobacteriia bacterium]
MGKLDKDGGKSLKLTRRQFIQAGAATAAVGAAGLDFAAKPSSAAAAEVAETYHTTCPYCSASCGQLIDVDAEGNVLDIYGDHQSPFNDGGLCAKGAGTLQLVNNPRRLGAWAGSHPVNNTFEYDPAHADGIAYRRVGNGAWSKVSLDAALTEAAAGLVAARGTLSDANYNSKGVAFFGSSHMNNEQNIAYRRLIAQFGTSNVEHQARI